MQSLLLFIVHAFYFQHSASSRYKGVRERCPELDPGRAKGHLQKTDEIQVKSGIRLIEMITINLLVLTNVVM